MKKNTLLKITNSLCSLIKLSFILIAIGITFIFIHIQIDKEYYSKVDFSFNKKKTVLNISNSDLHFTKTTNDKIFKSKINDKNTNNKADYKLNKLTTASLYTNYFKYLLILIALFLTVHEFQKIIESVKSHKTFGKDNVNSFRKIGKFIIVYTLLTLYNSAYFEQAKIIRFSISFSPLFFALLTFIMAEIFKEGNHLKEENNLTI